MTGSTGLLVTGTGRPSDSACYFPSFQTPLFQVGAQMQALETLELGFPRMKNRRKMFSHQKSCRSSTETDARKGQQKGSFSGRFFGRNLLSFPKSPPVSTSFPANLRDEASLKVTSETLPMHRRK